MDADLKLLHLSTVAISIGLFLLRAGLSLQRPYAALSRWLRIIPHLNDSLLLASAVGLALRLRQYPFVDDWLTAKLLALLAYILCGHIALKQAGGILARLSWTGLALALFAYIISVAVSRNPIPWF